MPGRVFSSTSYRYGFNGKENDNEVKGTGNEQDYGMRIYDPRVGRFLSVDPISKEYPELTPYQFAGDKPIWAVDLDGLEPSYTTPGRNGMSNTWPAGDNLQRAISPEHLRLLNQQSNVRAQAVDKAGISMTINLIPVVGEGKGLVEAFTGTDMITGEELGWLDRAINLLPYAGAYIRDLRNARKVEEAVKDVAKTSNGVKKAEIVEKETEQLFDGFTKEQRITKSATRPSFRKGVVEEVWENAKDVNGNVFDPNTGELLNWDKFKSRFDQWQMGHTPGNEWKRLRNEFIDGKKTWKQVLDEYNDPNKYLPEAPKSNMSHKFESKDPL